MNKNETHGSGNSEEQSTRKPEVPQAENKKGRKRKKKPSGNNASNEIGTEVGGFTVVGVTKQAHNKNVKRVLPNWLASPNIVSSNLSAGNVPVTSVGLDMQLVRILEQNHIPYLFPVQTQIIPWLLQIHKPKLFRPSDICVSAPTGSGKTLSYVLPLVQLLKNVMQPCIRAIVVLPTQLLASQVFSVISTYCKGTTLKVFLMSKTLTISAERKALTKHNLNGIRIPFDIIVATPGRLVDHLEQTEGFDISKLEFLVIDEADRTLDDQEGNWLHRLEIKFWSNYSPGLSQPWKCIPLNQVSMGIHLKAFQKLMFSATLSQNPEALEKLHLFQPRLFTSVGSRTDIQNESEVDVENQLSDAYLGKYVTPQELKESFVLCQKESKPLILYYLISHFKWKRVLCFVNTKEGTHRLCLLLKFMGNLKVREISSLWNAHTLDVTLKKFASGSIDVLVTSDQMARGIDIPMVDHVISYDVPGYTKTYIHRIGRTARAGQPGTAICLVGKEQIGIFRKTMKAAGKNNIDRLAVKNSDLKPFELTFKTSLEKLKLRVEKGESTTGRAHRLKTSKSKTTKSSSELTNIC